MKILVVDDDKTVFNVMREVAEWLLIKPAKIDHALNGYEGCCKIQKGHYDIIFMDYDMPIMNGVDATLKIRTFNKFIPIIGNTGKAKLVEKECIEAGMNDVLDKPADPGLYASTVMKWTKK